MAVKYGVCTGYDTGPQPSNKPAEMPHEYQASFMKYFDKKDEGAGGGSPRANPGPGNKGMGINIRNYFPNLPSNVDFKEYVSQSDTLYMYVTLFHRCLS